MPNISIPNYTAGDVNKACAMADKIEVRAHPCYIQGRIQCLATQGRFYQNWYREESYSWAVFLLGWHAEKTELMKF